jgi:uncharacterized protein YjbI with pentapeptide repeats
MTEKNMANENDVARAMAGDKNLEKADLSGVDLSGANLDNPSSG